MSYEKPIPLVPGDDWNFQIQTLNPDGTPANLTGFTILEHQVSCGPYTFDVGVVLSPGLATVTADSSETGVIEMGNVSTLRIKVQSLDGTKTTVIFKRIEGVPVVQLVEASTFFIGMQGPRGSMMLSGSGNPSNGLGADGDLYINRVNGEMWLKGGGVWTDTGDNIFGTIPADAATARNQAVAAAIAAGDSAFAAAGSATAAAASAAAALASKNAAGTSETNSASSAAAALASKNAAGTSETNAATSAAAALASKNAAGTSETNAAASATAANVAKITWRGAYSGATAYVTRDAVTFGGSSWVNKLASTGNAPPTMPATSNTWWDLLAQKGDVYEEYGVSIYKAANIDTGTYYADRSTSAQSTLTKLYGEVIGGDVGAQVDFYLSVNDVMVYGPVSAVLGTPVNLTGLAIIVPVGAKVSYVITYAGGNVTEFFANSYGATS